MTELEGIFTKEYLAQLDRLSLTVKTKLNTGGAGTRKSSAKGNSQEFSDFRDYVAGDDLKRVDWNSYARFSKLYLKLFLEEKQANIHLWIDSSKTMDFGRKFLFARALAGSLAYLSLKNMDCVSLYSWNTSLQKEKTKLQSPKSFYQAVQFLNTLNCSGESRLLDCIKQNSNRGQGISILLSDFFLDDDWQQAFRLLQYNKQDVILIWILAEEEVNPSLQGAVELIDSESGEKITLEITPEVQKNYQKNLNQKESQMKEFCRKQGASFVKFTEKTPLLQCINAVL